MSCVPYRRKVPAGTVGVGSTVVVIVVDVDGDELDVISVSVPTTSVDDAEDINVVGRPDGVVVGTDPLLDEDVVGRLDGVVESGVVVVGTGPVLDEDVVRTCEIGSEVASDLVGGGRIVLDRLREVVFVDFLENLGLVVDDSRLHPQAL